MNNYIDAFEILGKEERLVSNVDRFDVASRMVKDFCSPLSQRLVCLY